MNGQEESQGMKARILSAGIAGWFAYLIIDFLIHAVFLAKWWRVTENFWLPSNELFYRIPFAYASFAIYCVALTWLLRGLYGERPNMLISLRFSAIAGIVFGLGFVFGSYSVFRMPNSALVVWPVSIILESTIAGGVVAWVLSAERPWRRVGMVIIVAVVLFIIGIVVQNILFPTPTDNAVQ
jgi:hypothetical protein